MNWRRWRERAGQWREQLEDEAREHVGDPSHWRAIVGGVLGGLVLIAALGVYWSREPSPFDINASVSRVLRESNPQPVAGALTTATLIEIIDTLLDKPGGFINNDVAPPGVWLDDMPHWERGALQQTRDMTRALRDDFGRADAEAEADDDLARAEPRIAFSENSWMLPASESQYRDASDYLREYLSRLQAQKDDAVFVTSADRLDRYLARVTQRLDAGVQSLSASVEAHENPLRQFSSTSQTLTPSTQVDDIFYEARGSAWALAQLLRAVTADFASVLNERGAQMPMQEAIRALESAQATIYSPVILNGSGFGLVANHSLVMASYMARADTAVATVRRLLTQSQSANAVGDDSIH